MNMLFDKKDLKKLILPLMVEQTLALTIGMFDTIMVASAGESAVSGVALVDVINVLLLNLFAALATGGAIIAGQYLGARDHKNANIAAKQLLMSSTILGVLIMAVCLVFHRGMLSLFFGNVEADVMENAVRYFFIVALSYPFIAIFNAVAALFRGMGNSRLPMVCGLIMNGSNIVLNAVFIYGFHMGVAGAALGTLISRILGAAVIVWRLRDTTNAVSVTSYSLRDLDFPMIKRILGIGIPNGLENSIFQVGRIIMTSLVATFGTASIAAHAVGTSLTGLEIIPGQALGLAMTTIVAQCVGAGAYEQAEYYIKYLMKQAYVFLFILNVGMLFLLNPILGFYQLSGETFQMAFMIMLIHGIGAMVVWPVSFTLPNAFRASGDVKFPMYISILSMLVFRIGFSFLLAKVFDLGVFSIWIAMVIDWTFRAACFAWRYVSARWKQTVVIVN